MASSLTFAGNENHPPPVAQHRGAAVTGGGIVGHVVMSRDGGLGYRVSAMVIDPPPTEL